MNKKAVVNFLITLQDFTTEKDDLRNLYRDARSYKWDAKTIEAIQRGIALFHHKPSMLNDYIKQIEEKENDK